MRVFVGDLEVRIFNTETKRKEKFSPVEKNKVKMYVCGPTPYDRSHIGHARTYVFFDVVRRFFEYLGYEVKLVINLTDIDDKIIRKSRELGSWQRVGDIYSRYFFNMLKALRVREPYTFPRVTNHIEEIIDIVQRLIDRGFAYIAEDGVYFEVKKFKDYGRLSKIDLDSEKISRIEPSPYKRNPEDFAVWKFRKESEPFWYAPFGAGRPGWHIECSAMATKYLGKQFDIHGGGEDLIFPHHENEIAQSEAAFGVKPWVKYWMHVSYLTINKEKMSKSLGNIIGIDELLSRYRPEVIRLYLISAHYRRQLDFTWEAVDAIEAKWKDVVRAYQKIHQILHLKRFNKEDISSELEYLWKMVLSSMADDFNTPEAIKYISKIADLINSKSALSETSAKKALKIFKDIDEIFAIIPEIDQRLLEMGHTLLEIREEYRRRKDYNAADEIRNKLRSLGFEVEDAATGSFLYIF